MNKEIGRQLLEIYHLCLHQPEVQKKIYDLIGCIENNFIICDKEYIKKEISVKEEVCLERKSIKYQCNLDFHSCIYLLDEYAHNKEYVETSRRLAKEQIISMLEGEKK